MDQSELAEWQKDVVRRYLEVWPSDQARPFPRRHSRSAASAISMIAAADALLSWR